MLFIAEQLAVNLLEPNGKLAVMSRRAMETEAVLRLLWGAFLV